MSSLKTRVCIIGAGPSGLCALRALQSLSPDSIDVVCYERYPEFGGIWNFKGKEGIEEDGLEVHSGMYYGLVTNGPKETVELPDFLFDEKMGSFPDRDEMYKYWTEYVTKYCLSENILFRRWVENVTYNEKTSTFEVKVKNLEEGSESREVFDYVIVASGHFNYPNIVSYPGQETFPGLIIHSKQFLDANRYKEKAVLVVGSSYSAEDVALKCNLAGATRVTTCWRSKPMGFKWPPGIDERPCLTEINGSTVSFRDGSSDTFDVIIYCTGYIHHFPFLEDSLKLKTHNRLAPPLYHQVVFPSNPKVLYLGMQDQYYTFSMFWLQAHYCAKVIGGEIIIPNKETMLAWIEEDLAKEAQLKNPMDDINYQTEYLELLSSLTGQVSCNAAQQFIDWEHHKDIDITKYRTHRHMSIFR